MRIEVTDDFLISILEEMAEGIQEGDVATKRSILRQFVTKVELGKEKGRLWYTFPLSHIEGLYLVPLEGFHIKPRSLELVFA